MVSIFKEDGSLNEAQFTRAAMIVLDQARSEALRTRWSQIRSPHLALAIFAHPDSDVSMHSRKNGVKSEEIIRQFRKQFISEETADDEPRELTVTAFSENALECLKDAAQIAQARGLSVIDERDIWRAILMDPTNFFVRVLLANHVWPLRLLPFDW